MASSADTAAVPVSLALWDVNAQERSPECAAYDQKSD
jgi:hypothetical protein